MAYREVSRMDIVEIIRCCPAPACHQRIASGTGLSRNTVRKYVAAAKALLRPWWRPCCWFGAK